MIRASSPKKLKPAPNIYKHLHRVLGSWVKNRNNTGSVKYSTADNRIEDKKPI